MTREAWTGSEIAVVGMACRFPGASDPESYWTNLHEGVESVTSFSDEALLAAGVPPMLLSDPAYVKARATIENVFDFDASLFGVTPREAELLDPQQRLFVEHCWTALERAGYDPKGLDGAVGVYAGASQSSYAQNLLRSARMRGLFDGVQLLMATDKDFLATRVAYKLGLTGPAITIQTACSTSLVSVHVACQGLLAGECDMALAGGVSAKLPLVSGYYYQPEGILSRDGHCRAFDAASSGTVPGSGVGVVVLKRLEDALATGDRIAAVILGSAINNDGSDKIGFTAPSVAGQAKVVRTALQVAGVDPDTIGYVEAHGTGTALGDPIEVAALHQVFGRGRRRSCALGTAKSNFGHLDAAAGVAGFMKAALSLERKTIVPSLHFERANPEIDFDAGPFFVSRETSPWKGNGLPRRAGVSSFGIGGTNAHVVLEEAPPSPERPTRPAAARIFVLSASSAVALESAKARLESHLRASPDLDLDDAAFTLRLGRHPMRHRWASVGRGREELVAALDGDLGRTRSMRSSEGRIPETTPRVFFLFSGQGAQRPGMARAIYEADAEFRRDVDDCARILEAPLGADLREVLFRESATETTWSDLDETQWTQPTLFVTEYALARRWMRLGVVPDAMLGHSVGELVAAAIAEVFDIEVGLRLVAERGRLMAACPRGAMIALALDEAAAREIALEVEGVELAAVNAPDATVLSGSEEKMKHLLARLDERGTEGIRLRTSHGFHSSTMDEAARAFTEAVAGVSLRAPRIPFLSNVTGEWIRPEEARDPGYWGAQLRRTVRFADGAARLLTEEAPSLFLEVGPGRALGTLVRRQALTTRGADNVAIVSSLPHDEGSDEEGFLRAAARLWVEGVSIDWKALEREPRRRALLPTYPFERRTFEVEAEPVAAAPAPPEATRAERSKWLYVPSWKRTATPLGREGKKSYCLIGGPTPLVDALVTSLPEAEAEERVVRVRLGEGWSMRGDALVINPESADDYRRLVSELRRRASGKWEIGHLLCCGAGESSPGSRVRTFESLLHLARAASELDEVSISVISSRLQDVRGDESIDPERALLVGPVTGIPREYPSVTCRSIDVVEEELSSDLAVKSLKRELRTAARKEESFVAHRRGRRWIRSFELLRSEPDRPAPLRERGVYLVTGGLGGIGRSIAEDLARRIAARLVLVARRPLPPRDGWDHYLAGHPSEDPTVERIRAVQRMEAAGGEVLVAEADVCDRERMLSVLAEAESRFGPIRGVVHAAGVPGGGLIELKDREAARLVLAPKVEGTLTLFDLLGDRPLDFVALCSSLTGSLGAFGQVDYASACAFQDAFAGQRHREERPVVSIGWDTWNEVGMAVETRLPEELEERRVRALALGLSTTEGVEMFHRTLAAGLSRVLVSTRDLEARARAVTATATTTTTRDTASTTADATVASATDEPSARVLHERPDLGTEYIPPSSELERSLAAIWERVLGVAPVGAKDNFFELGADSFQALRFVDLLRRERSVSLTLVALYEAPTVEALAAKVEGRDVVPQEALLDSGRRAKARVERISRRRDRVKRDGSRTSR